MFIYVLIGLLTYNKCVKTEVNENVLQLCSVKVKSFLLT